jgi:hypothetical protein
MNYQPGMTFIDKFQVWLWQNYDSVDVTLRMDGKPEGGEDLRSAMACQK